MPLTSLRKPFDGMLLNNFAFELCGENRFSLATANIAEAMVTGIFDYLSTDVEKIANMTACIVTSVGHLKEVSIGIKNSQAKIMDKGSVKIVT